MIELNVPERRLHLEVSDEELARRKAEWIPPKRRRVDGTDCFSITSCRRTRELISTFWSGKAERRFHGIPIEETRSHGVTESHYPHYAALLLQLVNFWFLPLTSSFGVLF